MADAIKPLRLTQYAIESTKGTLVAATKKLVGDGRLVEEQDFYRPNFPRGVLFATGGAGIVTRKGTRMPWATDLSAQQVLIPLLTGIRGAVSPVGAGDDKTWTFTPQGTTAIRTIDTLTVEHVESDGSTNHYYGEAGYMLTERFGISSAIGNDSAKLTWDMFGRARQTGTVTGSLSPLTGIRPLIHAASMHYLDTSWAGLGGTQLAGVVRSVTLDFDTGLGPDHKGDGRSDLDFTKHRVGSITGTQQMVLEFDAVGAARFANWRANDLLYIRNKWLGPTVGSAVETVQVDGAWRFAGTPDFSEDEENVIVTVDLELVYDETGTKAVEFVVINGLSAAA